jgi:hypothetical protein
MYIILQYNMVYTGYIFARLDFNWTIVKRKKLNLCKKLTDGDAVVTSETHKVMTIPWTFWSS